MRKEFIFERLLPLGMAIHIGKKIKDEVHKQNIAVTEFAKRINRSRNVVYNIFDRENIDTELLHKIGKVLNCDFLSLYSSQKEYAMNTVKHFYSNEPPVPYGKQAEELIAMQVQNDALQKEVAYLKKIITLLEANQKIAVTDKLKKGKE